MLTCVFVTGDAICTIGAIASAGDCGNVLSILRVGAGAVTGAGVGKATTGGVFRTGVGTGVFLGGSVNWSHALIDRMTTIIGKKIRGTKSLISLGL